MTVTMGNQLVECQECHNLYHQDCHKPQVTDKEVNDPRLVWYCARCTRQMKRMVRKNVPVFSANPFRISESSMRNPIKRTRLCDKLFYLSVCFVLVAHKAQKPPQKPSPASASSAPVVKDTLVKKTELKLKTDTTSTFQAFKRTEVKVCVDRLWLGMCVFNKHFANPFIGGALYELQFHSQAKIKIKILKPVQSALSLS